MSYGKLFLELLVITPSHVMNSGNISFLKISLLQNTINNLIFRGKLINAQCSV